MSHAVACGDRNVQLATGHPDPAPEATALPQPNPMSHKICHAERGLLLLFGER